MVEEYIKIFIISQKACNTWKKSMMKTNGELSRHSGIISKIQRRSKSGMNSSSGMICMTKSLLKRMIRLSRLFPLEGSTRSHMWLRPLTRLSAKEFHNTLPRISSPLPKQRKLIQVIAHQSTKPWVATHIYSRTKRHQFSRISCTSLMTKCAAGKNSVNYTILRVH